VMLGMWWKRVSIADELLGESNMEAVPYFSIRFFFFDMCQKFENSWNGLILSACSLYGGA
jgi:hypothetical protein